MARNQTDEPTESIEDMLAKANAYRPAPPPAATLDAATIEKLGAMSKEELIALIKRCAWPQWALGMLTKVEIADRIMHQIAIRACDPIGREVLAACQQFLDREKGKAVTPIAAQIVVSEAKEIDKRELARKIDFLLSMGGNETPHIDS